MSESPYIHNVTAQNFQSLVLESSLNQPVLVDFWADWCQPCQTLMPMLAKLADEYAGKFILAKVNSDEQQELAAHFGIKSLPTMKLFVNGQMVDERMGVLPEPEIRAFIDKHIVSESSELMNAAFLAHQQGETDQALDLMNQALAKDPANVDLKITIAQAVYAQGDKESALALLDTLDEESKNHDGAVKLRAEIELTEKLAGLPPLEDIENRLLENPNDLEALLQKSHHLSARSDFEAAMECLLQIMRIDSGFEDDAGRTGLLSIFDLLGAENPLVQKYRRKLFTLLH
ncbi:MAG: putative thioredoxin [Gammaproteobacteria bacterium]|jgi:putative thioredoxin